MARFPEGRGSLEAFIHAALMLATKVGAGFLLTVFYVLRAVLHWAFKR